MANINPKKSLSFDDVLLVPTHSKVHPQEVSLNSKIGETTLKLPIFSAAMDTLTGYEMANALAKSGACGVVHKNMTVKKQVEIAALLDNERKKHDNYHFAFAVGVNDYERIYHLLASEPSFIVVDSAHGDTEAMLTFVGNLLRGKDNLGNPLGFKIDPMKLVVGNISTGDAAIRLYRAGVRIVKIGQGSGCFVGNTRVLMANGHYKDIKDIQVGDKVVNGLGHIDYVLAKKNSGYKKLVKYRHSLGIDYSYCTSDHEHQMCNTVGIKKSSKDKQSVRTLINKSMGKRLNWNSIGMADAEDWHCTIPAAVDFEMPRDFTVNMGDYCVAKKMDKIIKPSYNWGYLFGLFLGDGSSSVVVGDRRGRNEFRPRNTTGSVAFNLGNIYPEIISKAKKILDEEGFSTHIKPSGNSEMVRLYVWSLPLARFFQTFGKVDKKKLPEYLLVGNRDYLQGLYDGLIDSDGFQNTYRDRLSNTSRCLIELYGVLCCIIYNKWPSVVVKQPRSHVSPRRGLIEGRLKSYLSSNHSKLDTKILNNGLQLSKIIELEQCDNVEETYDIELRDYPSFIANNAVVHNSICSTRIVAGIGVPQFQALCDVDQARTDEKMHDLYIIADGGLRYSGDIVKALAAGANAVMLGGMLAGTDESLGGTEYRGMGSIPAMEAGSASRYNNDLKKLTPEGVEASVNAKGPVADVLAQIEGGIRAGMGYTGSGNLEELRESWFTEITNSGLKESHPHSLLSIKPAPNYK